MLMSNSCHILASIKDFEKAKEVVLKMEEENIVPSPQILRGIYSQFKSSGIDPAEFSPLFVSSFICILHKKLDGFQWP